MTAKIVSLETGDVPVNRTPDIVLLLEELLADAHAGRLEGLAVAVCARDGFIRCSWKGETKGTTMLGCIERLKYDMLVALEARE